MQDRVRLQLGVRATGALTGSGLGELQTPLPQRGFVGGFFPSGIFCDFCFFLRLDPCLDSSHCCFGGRPQILGIGPAAALAAAPPSLPPPASSLAQRSVAGLQA